MKASYDKLKCQKKLAKEIAEPIIKEVLSKYGVVTNYDDHFEHFTDLPIKSRMILNHMSYCELSSPMIRREVISGASQRSGSIKFDVTRYAVRKLMFKLGLCSSSS